MVPAPGLTFTVSNFTWTTGAGQRVETTEGAQIQSTSSGPSVIVGSINCSIDADEGSEIVALAQIQSVSGDSSSTTSPAVRSVTRPQLPHYKPRFNHDIDDLLEGFDRVTTGLRECSSLVESTFFDLTTTRDDDDIVLSKERPAWVNDILLPDSDLVITAMPKGRTIHLRPIASAQVWSEDRPGLFSFGYVNAASVFQLPEELEVDDSMCCMASLPTIVEEGESSTMRTPQSSIRGAACTVTEEQLNDFTNLPPSFGRGLWAISQDEPPVPNEMAEQTAECEARNADKAQYRQAEADAAVAANRGGISRDLMADFKMVGCHPIMKTPTANLAAAIMLMGTPNPNIEVLRAHIISAVAQQSTTCAESSITASRAS